MYAVPEYSGKPQILNNYWRKLQQCAVENCQYAQAFPLKIKQLFFELLEDFKTEHCLDKMFHAVMSHVTWMTFQSPLKLYQQNLEVGFCL